MTDIATLQNPFVIQCKQCQIIIADSFSLLDFKNSYLIFSSISSNTKVLNRKYTSDKIIDKDCTYFEISCGCGIIVGRKYITVTKKFEDFVDRFCFLKDLIDSYMLGAVEGKAEVSLIEVCDEVERLKRFCVYLYKRLEQ